MLTSCVLWIPEFPRDRQDETKCAFLRPLSLLRKGLAQENGRKCSEHE